LVPRREFTGVIGREWRDSRPAWPDPLLPPAGAANVLLIVLDDVGFAQLGCYGSDIETPHIDALAADGVRLTNFHTAALCSPTRACLLTGRNHHSSGMGRVPDIALGFPGYWGEMPMANGTLAEILRARGWATYAIGKWHLTPHDETNNAGDRSSWPLGRGFDRWYGFHGGNTHQFVPALACDNHTVRPPKKPEEGYHLTEDLADRAIEYLDDLRHVDPDQPFFLYFSTGAAHSPHHAPREWIDRYRGRYDEGWDAVRERIVRRQRAEGIVPPHTELSPRPDWIPAWDDLTPDDQRVAARFMECFAGFLAHTDDQIGRVLAHLETTGDAENTIVILVSDNGASAEGGATGSLNDIRAINFDPATPEELRARIEELGGPTVGNNYPWGWTMAGNTPFRRWKREVHEGGVADPCIVRWPTRLADVAGTLRRQFTHAIDVLPTILELVGVDAPDRIDERTQAPIEGTSFGYLLAAGAESAPEQHVTQHFEMFGSRAIYHKGWKAVTFKPMSPVFPGVNAFDGRFDDDVWELYHVADDPTEIHDLAKVERERLATMVELWWHEAERFQVLPLDNRPLVGILDPRPSRVRPRSSYRYRPHRASVPESVAAAVRQRSHVIEVEIEPGSETTPDGVLVAQGCVLGGWSLHVLGGYLTYVHNLYGKQRDVVASDAPVPAGARLLGVRYDQDPEGDGGTVTLLVDGSTVGRGEVVKYTPSMFNGTGAGLTCGYEFGPPIGLGYEAPFPYPGHIVEARIDTDGIAREDPRITFARVLAEQ
jgi:arylsulfatase